MKNNNVIGKGFDARPENINRNGRPKKLPELTQAFLNTLSIEDIEAIINVLLKKAKKGDIQAIRELLDRAFGKSKIHLEQTKDKTEIKGITFIDPEDDNDLTSNEAGGGG